MQNFRSYRALIVGGSGGVGYQVGRELAKKGATLIVHGGRDRVKFKTAIQQLSSLSSSIIPFWAPIRGTKKFLHSVRKWLPVDMVVLNYGPVMYKSIADSCYQDWKEMAEKNFVLPATLISMCFSYMIQQKYARIIAFGSDWSDTMRGYHSMAAYAAAKWALCSVLHSLQRQAKNPNFRCYALCPGYIVDTQNRSDMTTTDSHQLAAIIGENSSDIQKITEVIMQLLQEAPPPRYKTVIGIDKISKPIP